MKIVRLNKENFGSIQQTLLKRSTNSYPAEEAQVAAILQDVRERGDEALFSYTERFDHAAVTKETVLVTPEEVAEAYEAVDPKLLGIIRRAIVRIRAFHEHEKEESWFMTEPEGMVLGQRVTPLASAGVYVPGGKAVYPSSVIMNIIPAKVGEHSQGRQDHRSRKYLRRPREKGRLRPRFHRFGGRSFRDHGPGR